MTKADIKDRARVRIFPPAVPLATIAAGVILQRGWPLLLSLPAPERYWLGGGLIAVTMLGLGLPAVAAMRRSGQSESPWKPTLSIVDDGPFRMTRNPMYLQMVIVCLGFAIVLSNGWILTLTPVCALALQWLAILPEERYLEQKFGDEYRAYKRRVRRWI
jgi:protein-S-isoprenylcysteine O-methyltransferase Ste14